MTDYTGIALVIAAVGALISTIISSIAALKASNAEKQAVATHTAVNSRMDEFKKLFEETFRMKGAEEERVAGRDRAAAVSALEAPGAASLLAAAELRAQALIADATLAAAKLLAEAHKVSITNPTGNPVPVQVVGPGVDTPLKVTDDRKK